MKTKSAKPMATCTKTNLSLSYAYKRGCRCDDCCANKAVYTQHEGEKARLRARLWRRSHPERMRQYRKRSADKTWLNKHQNLLIAQDNKCAICGGIGGTGLTNGLRLHVDHDHKTDKIRGLLCGSCNVGLGHFKDDTTLLQTAIEYLRRDTDVY